MKFVPSQDDVIGILRETGALRQGHFEYASGLHSNEYLQVPLAMRYFDRARILSVGLSRLLRDNTEIRPLIPELSLVAPGMGGVPVAQGMCEALRAKKVYWAQRQSHGMPYRFLPFIQPEPGEQVILVDDILHSGANLADLKTTVESFGAAVIGLAVIVHQPNPRTHDFGDLPVYSLATLQGGYFSERVRCELCSSGVELTRLWI